ncbi:rhodanese-like domain-containing protein [Oleiagrimonas soli]|uniref:Membrane protein n=1 Tax=Oleiagrimonas soli TaxID=1543381 RepID=A0A099CZI7_9GAMM|nr:rhodanese-like domain-containing protein [Oleiagrimonas soli]KGI78992.1 membrane protein [Oleiagrimonas soli]MBB6184484.1 rhodanese-related sulfurtransferase [Oleiagrimonas soli]
MSDFLHTLPEFIGNHPWLSLLFVILLAAIIVGEIMRMMRKYKELNPAQVTLLVNREDALVVDISPYADFEKGHVPGARHVAMSQFDPENKDLAKAKDLPIVLVCKSGQTAGQAAQRLVKAGFTRVHTLRGGMYSWRQANMPMATGKR